MIHLRAVPFLLLALTLSLHPAASAAPEDQEARMAWFREAKFGLFIHWGLYYLLNIGPDASGSIPPASIAVLRTVGDWLKVNGDAVYGITRSPFGEEFGDDAKTLRGPDDKPVFLQRRQWRCTAKPGRLFFTVFEKPHGGLLLPDFRNSIRRAYLLDDPERTPVAIRSTAAHRVATIPFPDMEAPPRVLCVEIEGDSVER